MTNSTIGTLFREVRMNRGVSLNVAAGKHAPSVLSRFERGESDIRIAVAKHVLQAIGLDESRYDLNVFQTQQARTFPAEALYNAVVKGDTDAAAKLSARYHEARTHSKQTKLSRVIDLAFQTAALPNDSDFALSTTDEQLLLNFLAYPATWNPFERTIIMTTMRFASSELQHAVWDLAHQPHINTQDEFAFIVLANLMQTDSWVNDTVVHQLETDTVPGLGEINWPTNPVTAVIAKQHVHPSAENTAAVTHMLTVLQRTGFTYLADYIQKLLPAISHPVLSRHNPKLKQPVANPELIAKPDDSIATRMSKIRRRRGLAMDDMDVSWNRSTQSRFEHGKLEFGIMKLAQLCDALALDYGTIFGTASIIDQANVKLATADKADVAQIKQIMADFADQNIGPVLQRRFRKSTLDDCVRSIYEYNQLHLPAELGLPSPVASAEANMQVIGEIKHWYVSDLLNMYSCYLLGSQAKYVWRQVELHADEATRNTLPGLRALTNLAILAAPTKDAATIEYFKAKLTAASATYVINVDRLTQEWALRLCNAVLDPTNADGWRALEQLEADAALILGSANNFMVNFMTANRIESEKDLMQVAKD